MLMLSAVWSVLLVLEFTRGLSPALQHLNDGIWITFVIHFIVEFVAAPGKRLYLRKHWITAVSLAIPAICLLRLLRHRRMTRPRSHISPFEGVGRASSTARRGRSLDRFVLRSLQGDAAMRHSLKLVMLVTAAAATQIDQPRAEQYFQEAAALCERDGGALWGVSLRADRHR
jgi:hypothetical protein